MIKAEAVIGLPGYKITSIDEEAGRVKISASHEGPVKCPGSEGTRLRTKDRRLRSLRHESFGERHSVLELETRKYQCRDCGRHFWQRFPGVLPRKRATEPFRRSIYRKHLDGINRRRLGRREGIGSATVERWFQDFLRREVAKRSGAPCPRVLGIDEHLFTRKQGFATTFCDLEHHSIFDVVLGRSEASLESYLQRLVGKDLVRVVCMDLASVYRALVRKHFPNARIVADRFHVIRLINQQFLACWRDIDPANSKSRGLLSLMRRHRHNLKPEQVVRLAAYLNQKPGLEAIYRFKQSLCWLLLQKRRTRKQCKKLAPRFLHAIAQLRSSKLPPLVTLGETLNSWAAEIATMWRFTRNNGITEGFHTKMEMFQRKPSASATFKTTDSGLRYCVLERSDLAGCPH